jgi:hypothetical protein
MPAVPLELVRAAGPRVWFYKPEWRWWGWEDLVPFWTGHDEYSRNTFVIGWPITGRIIVARGWCGDRDCYEQSVAWLAEEWDD